ncbi:Tripartite tricarboxylate transporter TctB family protein [Lentibacillus halodurans]|uniref:Tripartite tricarboxylate transporter TctB family protein n=1 Tax=Lentibacillus halodurans TaxID=237679 RepID=A0A1I0XNS6_9BACI|nr:tripartite tricarboxylate transporter TctB family protein [Lentibacillus halodurans]SFB01613.1 Tripartite tricarboxylate transporter TctB family protein [Lentibacillus halodurans]
MRANYLLAIITIVVSAFFLVVAFQMPETNSTTTIGPMGWPIMILLFSLVMGVLLLLNTWLKGRKKTELIYNDIQSSDKNEVTKEKFHVKNRHFYILVSIAIYVLLLPILGFIIVTPFLFFFLAWLLGMGRLLKVAAITIVSNIVFVVLFIHLLGIPFPRGIGIFRSLSFLIY